MISTHNPTRSVTTARVDLYPSSVSLNFSMSPRIAIHLYFLSLAERPSPLQTCIYPSIWCTMLVQCSSKGGVRLANASGKLSASSFRISRTPSREWSSARTASSSARASLTSRMKLRRVGEVFEIALLVAKHAVEMDL